MSGTLQQPAKHFGILSFWAVAIALSEGEKSNDPAD